MIPKYLTLLLAGVNLGLADARGHTVFVAVWALIAMAWLVILVRDDMRRSRVTVRSVRIDRADPAAGIWIGCDPTP